MVLLLSAYGGHIDPRSFALPSLFTLGLPFVAFASLLVLVMCVIARSKWASMIVIAAILLSLPSLKLVCPFSHSLEPQHPDSTFTVMTWNVVEFDSVTDTTSCATLRYIIDTDADVVVLQEASQERNYLVWPGVAPLRDELIEHYPYHSSGYRDIVILSKVPYTVVEDTTLRNNQISESPWEHYHSYGKVFDLNIKGHSLRIVGLHMQSIGLSEDDRKLYNNIATLNEKVNTKQELRFVKHSLIDKLSSAFRRRAVEACDVRTLIDSGAENIIVCGDFNDTPASFCYNTIKGDDMRDSYVDCGTWPTYTFNGHFMYFKIDHMLYKGNMRALSSSSPRAGASDHYPVITTFEWE